MYNAIQLIGWVGAALLLLAYGLLTSGKLDATGSTYLSVNFGASIALGLSTATAHAWPSTTVNALWLVIGMVPLIRALRLRAAQRDSATESAQRDSATESAQRDSATGSAQRDHEISEQVGDVFDADREPHQVVAHA
jgi:hypothetical protein